MANLKTFSGFPIQNLTSDPVPYAQALANNPYSGAWSSGGNMNTTRFGFASGTGTQTAGMISSGEPTPLTAVEQYNGTSWTEVAEMNTDRHRAAGSGTQPATLIIAGALNPNGADSALVESWNGSAWTEVGDVNTARHVLAASVGGTYTSTIVFGGTPGQKANTESWNGSAWTEVNDLPTGKYALGGAGTSTAALSIGGVTTTNVNTVESWDGTNWTSSTAKNTSTGYPGSFGSQTAALAAGGWPDGSTELTNTESWNGSAWAEVNDMATARAVHGSSGAGSSSTGLVMGGYNSNSGRTTTEEWTFSGLNPATTPAADYSDAIVGQMYYNSTSGQFKAIKDGGAPIGTWASGGNLNAAKQNNAGAGTQTSAMSIDSESGTDVELYNGTSWTETTENNTARRYASANGPSGNTNVIFMGGYSTTNTGDTEIWNGSSWTEVNNLNVGRNNLGSAGTSTANVAFGGEGNPPVGGNLTLTELWNGSSWTEVNDLNEGRNSKTGAGTSTAALSTDGAPNTNAELWDGTSWTETTNFNTSRNGSVMTNSSPQNDAILITGQTAPGSFLTSCEHWNGTSWTEIADVGTAMVRGGGAGSGGTSGIKFGGATPSVTASTEEFTAADFTINPVTTS